TVTEGGILDGALGVLAGLEALQTIREAQAPHRRPLAVAAWSDEEGRYGSLFGSRAFCGRLDLTRVEAMTAVDGERLVDAMARAGFDPRRITEATAPAGAVAAYVELHIEQGPRLEEAGIPIGGVDVELQPMSATKPAICSARVQAAIEQACATLGIPSTRLYSAAGHDAQNLAAITDAGMIFIPSKGGRSHRVDEMSDWDALER